MFVTPGVCARVSGVFIGGGGAGGDGGMLMSLLPFALIFCHYDIS